MLQSVLNFLTELGGYWTLILYVVAVADVHHFSKWRAFETVTVIGILMIVCYAVEMAIIKVVESQITLIAR